MDPDRIDVSDFEVKIEEQFDGDWMLDRGISNPDEGVYVYKNRHGETARIEVQENQGKITYGGETEHFTIYNGQIWWN